MNDDFMQEYMQKRMQEMMNMNNKNTKKQAFIFITAHLQICFSLSIYTSWASVHEILWVCFTAVIAKWTLDFFGKFFKSLYGVLKDVL